MVDRPLISDRTILQLRGVVARTFTDTCNIERGSSAGRDAYGHPLPATAWAVVHSSLPCSFRATGGGGEQQTKDKSLVLGQYQLSVALGLDVLPSDQVTNLRDRFGVLRVPGNPAYNILQVVPTETHLLLTLQTIS